MSLGQQLIVTLRGYGELARVDADWLPSLEREIKLPETDDDELIPVAAFTTPPMLVFMAYRDSKGQESARHVTIYKVAPKAGHYMLRGQCHERKAWRTFRSDRVVELVTPADGEVFEDADAFVREYLLAESAHDSPAAALDAAFARCTDLMVALSFLARCDGHYDDREQEVIWHVLGARCWDIDYDPSAAARRIALLRPDFDDFIEAVERLVEEGDESALTLARGAVNVVNADRQLSVEEQRFMAELADVLIAEGYDLDA